MCGAPAAIFCIRAAIQQVSVPTQRLCALEAVSWVSLQAVCLGLLMQAEHEHRPPRSDASSLEAAHATYKVQRLQCGFLEETLSIKLRVETQLVVQHGAHRRGDDTYHSCISLLESQIEVSRPARVDHSCHNRSPLQRLQHQH